MYNKRDIEVVKLILEYLKEMFGDFRFNSRRRDDYYTKYICIFILRQLGFKCVDIAELFYTTHSTVIYAYKLIKYDYLDNPVLFEKITYAMNFIKDKILHQYREENKKQNNP